MVQNVGLFELASELKSKIDQLLVSGQYPGLLVDIQIRAGEINHEGRCTISNIGRVIGRISTGEVQSPQ